MTSKEFLKLFKIEDFFIENHSFSFHYWSLCSHETRISISVLNGGICQINIKTAEFGAKSENTNIILDLSDEVVCAQKEDVYFFNEIFPVLDFSKDSIRGDLMFLAEMIFDLLIPKYDLINSISYFGDYILEK